MDKAPEAFRTISEVAEDLDVPQHVLRFWESRFNQIRPMKRGGGRRYYRPDDVALLRGIRHLLYGQGYTIRGVQRILREQGIHFVQAVSQDGAGVAEPEDDIEAAAAAVEEEAAALPSNAVERREPTFDVPEAHNRVREPAAARPQTPVAASPQTPVAQTRGGLEADARRALRGALDDLAECRRLLDAALAEQA